MSIRRGLIGSFKRSLLPDEYTQIEYIGGTGTQYINPGIECTSDLVVNFGAMFLTPGSGNFSGGIDMRTAGFFRHHCTPTMTINYYISSGRDYAISINIKKDTKYDVFVDPVNGIGRVDSNTVSFTPLPSGLTTTKSYGILARIRDNGVISSTSAYCYYFKFYRNNALISSLENLNGATCTPISEKGDVCITLFLDDMQKYTDGWVALGGTAVLIGDKNGKKR